MVVIVELANVPNAKLKSPGSPLKAPLNGNNKRIKREAADKLKSMDKNNKLKGGSGYYPYGYYDSYYNSYYDSYYDSYDYYDSYYYDSYYRKK
jgi:hypothetical protein